MIEPMSVCELEAGRPRYHVPRFQMMAETSSAKTIANPAAEPTWSTSSTGSNATMLNATSPLEVSTPMRFQMPDHITAILLRLEWRIGVVNGGHSVGRIVEAVDKLKSQGKPYGNDEEKACKKIGRSDREVKS